MNIFWIILSLQVTLLTVSFTVEAGKKGTESGIIVINNTGGGKCGGSAKTIVKTAPKGKKGKGGKGKGHTIIASSGGGGGGGGCKCGGGHHAQESKVVAIPVPVPVTYHDNKFMHRRTSAYEQAASGTRMMPVFVSANAPISIAGSAPTPSMVSSSSSINHYPYGVASHGGDIAVSASTNPFINPFTVTNTNAGGAYNYMAAPHHPHRSIGDHGLLNPSEARQMFSLLPAQQLGHHFAHSVNHASTGHSYGPPPSSLSSNGHHHHGYPQISSYGTHGDSGYLNHQPTPFNSMPIYEPIRADEDYMGNVNHGDERPYHHQGGPSSSSSSSHSSDGPSSSSSASSMDDDESRNYQTAALSPSSGPGILRKPSNYDDSPASPSSSPLSSASSSSSSSSLSSSASSETKDKSSSGYWPERA